MKTTAHKTCPRCNGARQIQAYRHVAQGICFECGGLGVVDAETGSQVVVLCAEAQAEKNAAAAAEYAAKTAAAEAHRAATANDAIDFLALLAIT